MRTILALIFSLLATAASAQPGPGPTQPWIQNGLLIYYPGGSVNAGTPLNNTGAGTFNASNGYYLNNSLVQSVTATDAPLNYSAGTLSLNINSSLTVDGSNNLGINLSHANSWSASQTFSDGATFSAAITYGGVTLSNSVTGTGAMVLSSGSTIANPTFTGSVSAAGLITNTDLAYDYVYVNGVPCTLGVASPGCSITATAANVTVGGGSPTGVINGTPGDILAVGSGPSLTQIAVTGSGSIVLATAPTIAGETVSGTANFIGTFEIGGQAETFPASGLIVGTTDIQSLTNKSIAGSEINSGTVGAAYLPIATSAAQGIVQGDGSTLTINTGVISCTTMTASQIGCGYPDNSTIVVVSGKLTVIGAAASSIAIGVTSIGGGTSGDLLSNSSGTLSQVSLGTGLSVSGGAINTPWSYSGTNIYNNNAGVVGIGFIPGSQFGVEGTAGIVGAGGDYGAQGVQTIAITSPVSYNLYLGLDKNSPYGGYAQVANAANTANKPFLLNPLGGYIGIGIRNPIGNLDVENGSGTAQFCLNNACGANTMGVARMWPRSNQTASATDPYNAVDPWGNQINCSGTSTACLQEFITAAQTNKWPAEVHCTDNVQIQATTSVTIAAGTDWHFHADSTCNLNFSITGSAPGLIVDSQGAGYFDWEGRIVYSASAPNTTPSTPTSTSCVVMIYPHTNTSDGFAALYAGVFKVKTPVSAGTNNIAGVICAYVASGQVVEQTLEFSEINGSGAGGTSYANFGMLIYGSSGGQGFQQNTVNINQIHGYSVAGVDEGYRSSNASSYNSNIWKVENIEGLGSSSRGIDTWGSNDLWEVGYNGGTADYSFVTESTSNNNIFIVSNAQLPILDNNPSTNSWIGQSVGTNCTSATTVTVRGGVVNGC